MTLVELQREFCAHILGDKAPDEARFGKDAEIRVGIYRNAYRARLMDCLRASFEKTWSWIGDEAFEMAARQHAILNPPHSWTLDDYGTGFEVTLATLFPNDPEIAELAWLEWAMQRAFASVDEMPLSVAAAQAQIAESGDMDGIRLYFIQSLRTSVVRTNCTEIWQAIADDVQPPPSVNLADDQYLRVWRKGLSPHFRICQRGEMAALSMMQDGVTFGTLCTNLAAKDGHEAAVSQAGTFLGAWLADGLVGGLS